MIGMVELLIAASALLSMAILAVALLKGWQDWLKYKNRELDMRFAPTTEQGSREGMARIEIADMKERLRKLEAIASGVDL